MTAVFAPIGVHPRQDHVDPLAGLRDIELDRDAGVLRDFVVGQGRGACSFMEFFSTTATRRFPTERRNRVSENSARIRSFYSGSRRLSFKKVDLLARIKRSLRTLAPRPSSKLASISLLIAGPRGDW